MPRLVFGSLPRFTLRLAVRLASLVLGLGFLATLIGLGMYLYVNLYQTYTQADEIVLLRRQVAPEAVDTKKVESLRLLLETKTNPPQRVDWASQPDPFAGMPAPAVAPVPEPSPAPQPPAPPVQP